MRYDTLLLLNARCIMMHSLKWTNAHVSLVTSRWIMRNGALVHVSLVTSRWIICARALVHVSLVTSRWIMCDRALRAPAHWAVHASRGDEARTRRQLHVQLGSAGQDQLPARPRPQHQQNWHCKVQERALETNETRVWTTSVIIIFILFSDITILSF